MTVFQACKEDDDPTPAPTVTGPTSVASVQIGTAADVTFTFKADGGYASAAVAATGGTAVVKTQGTAGAATGSVVVTFTADNTPGAATVTLTVTDGLGQTAVGVGALNKTISAPPSVALSSATGAANPGGTTTVTVTVTAENGVKNISYTTTGGLTGEPASPIAVTEDGPIDITFTVPASAVLGSELTASISATDDQDLNSTAVLYTVTASTNELTGKLEEDMTLEKGVSYLIKGQFIVTEGVTLTVEPGAIIRGDKVSKGVLIVKQGGILNAEGTVEEPIVFTSSKGAGDRDRGDWGGIIIMGNGYINQKAMATVEGLTAPTGEPNYFKYGTFVEAQDAVDLSHDEESSGILKYVRIEYAGIELVPNSETNTLTLAAVGSGTTIDYVQASYGGDDGFEWFGGSANASHLISLGTWDDDFDTDFGWRGNVQFGLAVRAPFLADQSGSTAFESDSQGNADAIGTVCNGTTATGCTQGVFSNITVIGPRDFNNTRKGDDPSGVGATRAISANYTRAMHIRRRSAISVFNSVITGFGANSGLPTLTIDDAGTVTNYTNGVGGFGNNFVLFPGTGADAPYGTNQTLATVKDFWVTGNAVGSASTVVQPGGTFANSWTPANVDPQPTGATDPYPDFGLTADFFFGTRAAAAYTPNPNWAVTEGDLIGLDPLDLFASAKLGDFFVDDITFKGAFGANDWTEGWSEFVPVTAVY